MNVFFYETDHNRQVVAQELIALNPRIADFYFAIVRRMEESGLSMSLLRNFIFPVIRLIADNAKSNYFLAHKLLSPSVDSMYFIKMCACAEGIFQYESTYEAVRKELLEHYPSAQMMQYQSPEIEQEMLNRVFEARNSHAKYGYSELAFRNYDVESIFVEAHMLFGGMGAVVLMLRHFSHNPKGDPGVIFIPILVSMALKLIMDCSCSRTYILRRAQLLVQKAHHNCSQISISSCLNHTLIRPRGYARIANTDELSRMEEAVAENESSHRAVGSP